MEIYQDQALRWLHWESKMILRDLLRRGLQLGTRQPTFASPHQKGDRTPKTSDVHPLSLDGGINKRRFLLLDPKLVEIPKPLDDVMWQSEKSRTARPHMPAITPRWPSLHVMEDAVSQSTPYLHRRRRSSGSFSSLINRQEGGRHPRATGQSNVIVSMTYLGKGLAKVTPDELKVMQQDCRGESIRVFKGYVRPGDQFQFVSKRHQGVPFSVTMYVNGTVVARISSCCEYSYAPGVQQGRGSCFRVSRLSGGQPCPRCAAARNTHGPAEQLKDGKTERCQGSLESNSDSVKKPGRLRKLRQKFFKDPSNMSPDTEDLSSSEKEPGLHMQRAKHRRRRKKIKSSEADKDQMSAGARKLATESSNPPVAELELPSLHLQTTYQKKTKRAKTGFGKLMSCGRNTWEEEHCKGLRTKTFQTRLVEKLSFLHCHEHDSTSEVELSEESDSGLCRSSQKGPRKHFTDEDVRCPGDVSPHVSWRLGTVTRCTSLEDSAGLCRNPDLLKPKDSALTSSDEKPRRSSAVEEVALGNVQRLQHPARNAGNAPQDTAHPQRWDTNPVTSKTLVVNLTVCQEVPKKQQDLQMQVDAVVDMLRTSDQVDRLVLRNTGLDDELLGNLAAALKTSQSEVKLINLNLNHIGPPGVQILLDLLKFKPQVTSLLLFGNQLGDTGVCALLVGMAKIQNSIRVWNRDAECQHPLWFSNGPASAYRDFRLVELDLGGNGIKGEGLRALAAHLRQTSQLQYLGLAQTSGVDMTAWAELFDSLRTNDSLHHIILDESDLGNFGAQMFAQMLVCNRGLSKVDLDNNCIGEEGGLAIAEALLSRTNQPLEHLSLEGNNISSALMTIIQQRVKTNPHITSM
ncbi:hypothetical protein GN956_G9393 [Arapaima gigas]